MVSCFENSKIRPLSDTFVDPGSDMGSCALKIRYPLEEQSLSGSKKPANTFRMQKALRLFLPAVKRAHDRIVIHA
jgi:hypothetical protein